jgi:hypothetical protein
VEFIWVTVKCRSDEDGYHEHPKLDAYLGDAARCLPYNYNKARKRRLPNFLYIYHRDTFLKDGSKLNQGIVKVTGGKLGHPWAGNIIVLRTTQLGIDDFDIGCSDIDMGDFRDSVDYFVSYGNNDIPDTRDVPETNEDTQGFSLAGLHDMIKNLLHLCETEPIAPKPKKVIKAVRINCLGDIEKSGRKKFEAIDLPVNLHGKCSIPPLSTKVGMKLELTKIPPPASWRDDRFQLQNQVVTFLHLNCDPKSSEWGWAPQWWQDWVGSVIVARADGEDLHPFHVAALCHFIMNELWPLFEDSMEPKNPISREEVLYRMSPKNFELFYRGWCNYGKILEKDIEDAPFPKIAGSAEKVKGLRKNFHVLSQFL